MECLTNINDSLTQSIRYIVNNNTTAFEQLRSSINQQVDLLNGMNQSNNGSEVYEGNERTVNEAYLGSVAINEIENIFNYAAPLLNVASQCPISGGPAVYRARSLYFLINPELTYDDAGACIQSGYLYKSSRNFTHKSKLYPNPSLGEVTVVYNISENALFQITDAIGRIVKTAILKFNQVEEKLFVNEFENGIYYYNISDNKGRMIDAGQFIISK